MFRFSQDRATNSETRDISYDDRNHDSHATGQDVTKGPYRHADQRFQGILSEKPDYGEDLKLPGAVPEVFPPPYTPGHGAGPSTLPSAPRHQEEEPPPPYSPGPLATFPPQPPTHQGPFPPQQPTGHPGTLPSRPTPRPPPGPSSHQARPAQPRLSSQPPAPRQAREISYQPPTPRQERVISHYPHPAAGHSGPTYHNAHHPVPVHVPAPAPAPAPVHVPAPAPVNVPEQPYPVQHGVHYVPPPPPPMAAPQPPKEPRPMHGARFVYGQTAARVSCQHCGKSITTKLEFESGIVTWSLCVSLCAIGCGCGCCLIPFSITSLKNVVHICPHCGKVVGKCRPCG